MKALLILLLSGVACFGQFNFQDAAFISAPASAPATDPDALVFFAKLGGVSSTITNAVNTFCKTLKADGTWTNFDAFYPNVGANIGSNAVNLISTNYYAVVHNTPAASDASGTTGNGSNFYLDTGWVVTNQNSFTFYGDVVTNSTVDGSCLLGAYFSGGNNVFVALMRVNSTQTAGFFSWNYFDFTDATTNPAFPSGFLGVRNGATSYLCYWGSVQQSINGTWPSSAPPVTTMWAFANNNGSGGSRWWNGKSRCWGFGNHALSASQQTNFINAVSALNTALSR